MKVRFPSLYSCTYSNARKLITDLPTNRRALDEAVGEEAALMGGGRDGILIRPVMHGAPCDERGYGMLAQEALRRTGVESSRAAVVAGVPFDSRENLRTVKRMITSKLSPASCLVLPQAYGTLVSCGRTEGCVINVGHGTTEIMSILRGRIDGTSVQKASEFVTGQLSSRSKRAAYVEYGTLLKADPHATERLVGMLARHIADEASRMNLSTGVILAGGGSLMPTMRETLEGMLGIKMTIPEDPVFSNAIGLEKMAATIQGIPTERERREPKREPKQEGEPPGEAKEPRQETGEPRGEIRRAGDAP
ncbi:hypothetical protein CENSYa_0666 [Cenarchaeum symbiosum A]|uniref:Uncharacterized protein n=1 Tax=Cenarchaeum symbiosum (strain A) TaxID=414004 RepID=A0RVD2_CENSY|nr:hypothetical protein CENSYa_0666 [Cenarchaeum symbiosum A]